MKTKTSKLFLSVLALFALAFTLSTFAQTNTPPSGPGTPPPALQLQSLILLVIPILVPLIIALGKWFIPSIPGWSLPIVAPALGALTDWLLSLASGTVASAGMGALLGSAGVGIRELKDQVQTRIQEGKPGPKLPSLFIIGILSLALTGCTTTAPDGTQVKDPIQTQQVKDALEPFVRIPVRRTLMNSPQHTEEIAKYYRGIASVFCSMAAEKRFDPTTLTRALQDVAMPFAVSNPDLQALLDFRVALEKLYKVYWNDRLSAAIPADSFLLDVSEFFCVAINNGLKDAGQRGTVNAP